MRAAKYKRISSDREGRELGVERQDEHLDKLIVQRGLTLDPRHDYTDNDIGASTRSRKKIRKDYQRMLAAARAGEFDVIVAYTTSRLTRRPREHEDLIELAEQHGIKFMYVASPSFDLGTSNGRKIARMLAAQDAGESEDISERVKDAAIQRARDGGFHGGTVPFGYRSLGKGSRKIEVDPVQAALLNDAARRVLNGEAMYAICDEWNSRGVLTQRGKHWRGRTLRVCLLSPSVIGQRVLDGKTYDADWPAIMDAETWLKLEQLLTNPNRLFRPTTGAYEGKKALGGIAHCVCGKRLISQRANGVARLMCHKQGTGGCGKIGIGYDGLEAFVLDMVFARLDSKAFRAALAERQQSGPDTREAGLRDELEQLNQRRVGVGRSVEYGAYTEAEARQALAEITRETERIRMQLNTIVRDRALDDIADVDDPRALWSGADVTRRRRFLSSLIDSVIVSSFPDGQARNLSRRRNETDESLKARRDEHNREMLRQRILIKWRV
jgi:site-specific DNA recombinase